MTSTMFGPVEFVALGFSLPEPPASIEEAVLRIAASGSVTLLDIAVIRRNNDGESSYLEAEELPGGSRLAELTLAAEGLIGEDDLDAVQPHMPNGSSALVVLFEHTWARDLVAAAAEAPATVLAVERIPAEVVNQIAQLAQSGS